MNQLFTEITVFVSHTPVLTASDNQGSEVVNGAEKRVNLGR